MTEPILLIGAGGHCKSVIEVIESSTQYAIAGIIDRKELVGTDICGYTVIGTDDDLPVLIKEYRNVHITVGHIRSGEVRVRLYDYVKRLGAVLPPIVAASAIVSSRASIGEGTIVMHQALVNARVVIGHNTVINTKATIEHDAEIGDHCHISTGALVNGNCTIGNKSFIGSGACIIQGMTIAPQTLVAAGAVVIHPTKSGGMYAGNPAVLKKQYI
jgi:sugar O-acyltransferase (sialic acid O-acetyltransferase NeuD family)